MTDKQAIIDAINRLPDSASLEQIAEAFQILAAIRKGQAQIADGQCREHQEVEELLESWTAQWSSK